MLFLAACGGAEDDEAGSLTTFSTVPDQITVTGAVKDVCPGATTVGKVFIYGGTAPYRLDNTFPNILALDKSTVGNRGGSFTVTSLGGCLTPGLITVVDALDRQVTVEITLAKGE